jgi:acyl-CoA thioesterase FadM
LNIDRGVGTPFVRVAVEFRSPITPRDMLATQVRVARLGRSSLTFAVIGRVGERVVYEGELTSVFIARSTGRAIPIPEEYRAKLV